MVVFFISRMRFFHLRRVVESSRSIRPISNTINMAPGCQSSSPIPHYKNPPIPYNNDIPKRHSFHTTSTLLSPSYPPHTLFPMPALSPTMSTGTIAKWNLAPGQSFTAGDVLCEIGTDKATMDYEAQDDGVLAKILCNDGDGKELKVGVPICVVVEDEADADKFEDFVIANEEEGIREEGSVTISTEADDALEPVLNSNSEKPKRDIEDAHVLTPAARHLSQSKNMDATYLEGTGKGGRVTKGDVLLALKNRIVLPPLNEETPTLTVDTSVVDDTLTSTPVNTPTQALPIELTIPTITASGGHTDIPSNNMRKVIAKRLTESKSTVPHFYSSIEIELDEILALRKKLKSTHDVKVSVNDIILKASALALRDVPEVNSTAVGDNSTASVSKSVDISVAVATPTGLITPIVSNTDKLGLSEISSQIKDLASRAREGKLAPEEYQGGSFCISNLGMFGITEFSAVINPPQAAILAVGGGVKRVLVNSPWIDGVGKEEQDTPKVKSVMTARLSADRRVVDEPTAALFLATLRHYLNKPELLLL